MAQLYRLSHYFWLQLYEQLRWCFFPKGLRRRCELSTVIHLHQTSRHLSIHRPRLHMRLIYLARWDRSRRFGVRVRMTAVIITIRCDQ